QGEALTMSDRIAVMNDGIIEHLGTPREIYERPATKFVANFIGTSNILSGTVSTVDSGFAVITYGPEDRVVIPVRGNAMQPGQLVERSVRPEKIEISTASPAIGPTGSVLRGRVSEVVYLGTSTNYTVATAAGVEMVVFDQNASSAEDVAVRGDAVYLSWNP